MAPLTSYQKKLFAFLSVATFFEGYDFLALSQILPEIGGEMKLDERGLGLLGTFISLGTVAAYFLVRKADSWGRKRVLTITIIGYTLFTFATGFAPNIYVFALCQFVARIFLIAEWAISTVYAAEEFPAERRGMVIGVISACASLGSIVCAGVVPLLLHTPWGWRTVYFVGIIPLVILAFARRGLRETARFQATGPRETAFFRIWQTPQRRRVVQIGVIWGLTYLCTNTSVYFWKLFATRDAGLSAGQAGLAIALAAVVSMPLVFLAGKLIDVIGRKRGAVVIFGAGVLGTLGCYGLRGQWPLTGALVFGIFGSAAILPVLNALTAELFPTEQRAEAFAWANNIIGRIGYVGAPALIGWIAGYTNLSVAVRLSVVGPIAALALIWLLLPETSGRELEEIA